MAKKKKLSFEALAPVVEQFRAVVLGYTNVKRIGEVAGAALMMFIEASEEQQRTYINRIKNAETYNAPKQLLESMLQNHQNANERDARETEDAERRRGESVVRSAQARQQDPLKKGRKHA